MIDTTQRVLSEITAVIPLVFSSVNNRLADLISNAGTLSLDQIIDNYSELFFSIEEKLDSSGYYSIYSVIQVIKSLGSELAYPLKDKHVDWILRLFTAYKINTQGLLPTLFTFVTEDTSNPEVKFNLETIHSAYPGKSKLGAVATCYFALKRAGRYEDADLEERLNRHLNIDTVLNDTVYSTLSALPQPFTNEVDESNPELKARQRQLWEDVYILIRKLRQNPEIIYKESIQIEVNGISIIVGNPSHASWDPHRANFLGFTPGIYNVLGYTTPEHSKSIHDPDELPLHDRNIGIYIYDTHTLVPIVALKLRASGICRTIEAEQKSDYDTNPTLQLFIMKLTGTATVDDNLQVPLGDLSTSNIFEATRLGSASELIRVTSAQIHDLITNRGYNRSSINFFLSILTIQARVAPALALENFKVLLELDIISSYKDRAILKEIFKYDIFDKNSAGIVVDVTREMRIFKEKMDTTKAGLGYVLGIILASQGKALFGNSKTGGGAASFARDVAGVTMQFLKADVRLDTKDVEIFQPYLSEYQVSPFFLGRSTIEGCLASSIRYFGAHPDLNIFPKKQLSIGGIDLFNPYALAPTMDLTTDPKPSPVEIRLFPGARIFLSRALTLEGSAQLESEYGDPKEYFGKLYSRIIGYSPYGSTHTAEQLERFGNKKVLVIGGGSVGSTTAEAAARHGAGLGNNGLLTVIDPQIGGIENIQRQSGTAIEVGRAKVESVVNRVGERSPFAKILGVQAAVTPGTVAELCSGYDIVIMAADATQPQVNHAILAYCFKNGKPVYGGLDLANTAISWSYHPEREGSPLLNGVYYTNADGSIDLERPINPADITNDLVEPLNDGSKMHSFAWLGRMIDPVDLPIQMLANLIDVVRRGLLGQEAILIQSNGTAITQAQATINNIFADLNGNGNGAVPYYAINSSLTPLMYGLLSKATYDESKRKIATYYKDRKEWILNNLDPQSAGFDNSDPVNARIATILMGMLGISIQTLIVGRSVLGGFPEN